MKTLFQWMAGLLCICIMSHASAQIFQLVKDINPQGDATPSQLFAYNGKLYFTADDGSHGRELWVSDGTENGTFMLKDINPGVPSSNPVIEAGYNGLVYFSANDNANNLTDIQLWVTDGTTAGTHIFDTVQEIFPMDYSFGFFKSSMLFEEYTDSNIQTMVTDGTPSGTEALSAQAQEPTFGATYPYFTTFNDTLYFNNNGELMKSDGTDAGTQAIYSITCANLFPFNGKLYFNGSANGDDGELWVTDGTANGTQMLSDFDMGSLGASVGAFFVLNDTLFFTANSNYGNASIWFTDGTPSGTLPLSETVTGGPFFSYDGTEYFDGKNANVAPQIFETNGTPLGTVPLSNPVGNYPFAFTILDNLLFYIGYDGTYGNQLYEMDLVQAMTLLDEGYLEIIYDDGNGVYNSLDNTRALTVFNNSIYYNATYNDSIGNQLYSYTPQVTGITTLPTQGNVKIYPNPAQTEVMFMNGGTLETTYVVWDIIGVKWLEGKLEGNTVQTCNLSSLSSGVYLVTFVNRNGQTTKKLVIAR